MKIYIDDKQLKTKNYELIKANFPNINFTNQIEDSYDANAIIVFPEYVTKVKLEKYSNLQWIQLYTAGFNSIDLDYLEMRKIELSNARGVYSKTIAEDVIAKILTFNRNIRGYSDNMQKALWQPLKSEFELVGSTVGIIGTGSIGTEIAKRLKAFETTIIGYRRTKHEEMFFDDIYTGQVGLETLLTLSDYVILALPLNDESFHLINFDKLKLMKRTALLINISRGEIINQDDLIKALSMNLIRGAALDVTTPEPLPQDSPLWHLPNAFITPHNAVSSPYLIKRLINFIMQNIKAFVGKKQVTNRVHK